MTRRLAGLAATALLLAACSNETTGSTTTQLGEVGTTFTGAGRIGIQLTSGGRVDNFRGATVP